MPGSKKKYLNHLSEINIGDYKGYLFFRNNTLRACFRWALQTQHFRPVRRFAMVFVPEQQRDNINHAPGRAPRFTASQTPAAGAQGFVRPSARDKSVEELIHGHHNLFEPMKERRFHMAATFSAVSVDGFNRVVFLSRAIAICVSLWVQAPCWYKVRKLAASSSKGTSAPASS